MDFLWLGILCAVSSDIALLQLNSMKCLYLSEMDSLDFAHTKN